jgi:hypothetical protein
LEITHPSPQDFAMCATSQSAFDNSHYERACDQAIAMCDGNLRSTIKALIMANEYLEGELLELQAAVSCGCVPGTQPNAGTDTCSQGLPGSASSAA